MPQTQKTFSFPDVTKRDLQDEKLLLLNRLLRFLGEQISKTQGGQGPFTFDLGPITFRGTLSLNNSGIAMPALKVFNDNQSAKTGGIPPGGLYRTSTGQIMAAY